MSSDVKKTYLTKHYETIDKLIEKPLRGLKSEKIAKIWLDLLQFLRLI